MPHSSLQLQGGVNQTETPALNQASISTSNLIRFLPDAKGLSLAQKLGGWSKFLANTIYSVARALWAWEDTAATAHLAVGMQNAPNTYECQLSVVTNGSQQDITPRSLSDNIAPVATSTMGSSIVLITDTTIQNITQFDAVYIPVHIAIGGLIVFGLYQADPDGHLSATSWTVNVTDILGNDVLATSGSSSPTVAEFATTSGSSTVTVTLTNHGYSVGSIYPVLVSTTVGGIVFFGEYVVQTIVDADNFTINGTTLASASTTGFINNGNSRCIYGFGIGAIPAGTGYGIGGYGRGGYGTGTAVIPTTGIPISARDWTLDNWGQILMACAITPQVTLTTTGASGNGTTGTLTYSTPYTIPVGQGITVSNVTPTSWNGSYLTTAGSSGSVSFLTSDTSAQTGAGTITVQNTPYQPIYGWDALGGAPKAGVIPQAPPVNDGIFIAMPERILVAWGSTFTGIQDPLLIRWSDVNNFTVWVAQITNQAGSYRLPRGSRIVGAIQGPQQGLIFTDIAVWDMQYLGPPLIWGFNQLGAGCGLLGRKAVGVLGGVVYWMGPSQFYSLSGEGVQPIVCPVWDVIFQDLDQTNLDRIRVAVNSLFNEISWYYPTISSGGEVNAYVKYNASIGVWDYGTLARSAWIDQSVLGPPIGTDPNALLIYQHETSTDADGQALDATYTTGYFALSDGDDIAFVDQVWPDFRWGYFDGTQNATVNLTFYATDYPGQAPRTYGPYAVTQSTQYISPRIRGRLFAMSIGSTDVGSFWRTGIPRFRIQPDGRF